MNGLRLLYGLRMGLGVTVMDCLQLRLARPGGLPLGSAMHFYFIMKINKIMLSCIRHLTVVLVVVGQAAACSDAESGLVFVRKFTKSVRVRNTHIRTL